MPKISIITASYNYDKYISQTIDSVLQQTIEDWELIIVDDGSSDNSIKIIKDYVQNDDRIKLIIHENHDNKGLIATLQKGIDIANGDYVVFLESDDYIRNDYLDKKLKIFQQNASVGLVYNGIKTFGCELPKKYANWLTRIGNYWAKHDYPHNIHQMFAFENYIPTFSCVMLRKELLDNLDWSAPQPAWIDLWLWIQVSKKCNFYYISENLTFWRIHKDSYLNNAKLTNPVLGYLFYKNILFNKMIEVKRIDYKLKFIYSKFVRLIYYKWLTIIK